MSCDLCAELWTHSLTAQLTEGTVAHSGHRTQDTGGQWCDGCCVSSSPSSPAAVKNGMKLKRQNRFSDFPVFFWIEPSSLKLFFIFFYFLLGISEKTVWCWLRCYERCQIGSFPKQWRKKEPLCRSLSVGMYCNQKFSSLAYRAEASRHSTVLNPFDSNTVPYYLICLSVESGIRAWF